MYIFVFQCLALNEESPILAFQYNWPKKALKTNQGKML